MSAITNDTAGKAGAVQTNTTARLQVVPEVTMVKTDSNPENQKD